MEYASKATADAGLTTGIIGTALGALNSGIFNGGLGNLFGGVKYGVDRTEFYADLAKAFLFDKDGPAPSEKLAEYYHEIVK